MTKIKKKIHGLVLSGGASRFFAQIGALIVLYSKGFKADYIAGCSAGSFLGVCLAAGLTPEEIETEFLNQNPFSLIDLSLKKSGLIKGEKLSREILKIAKVKTFEDLKIPLRLNATNINTGEELVFFSGNLDEAINATIAFPGVFAPKKINSELYIDGGIYNALPVELIPEANVVVAIDVSFNNRVITQKSSPIQILFKSAYTLQRRLAELEIERYKKGRDFILIRPPVEHFMFFEYKKEKFKSMIKIGEEEAQKVLNNISF